MPDARHWYKGGVQRSPGEVRQPNRALRLARILDRDGTRCFWCQLPFTAVLHPTTDHLIPRLKGGPSWMENEVAACRRCNSDRGHLSPVDWLRECETRGWHPDRTAVRRMLVELASAIARRGGNRAARQAIDGQLRRLPSAVDPPSQPHDQGALKSTS